MNIWLSCLRIRAHILSWRTGKTSPCSPRALNSLYVLPSRMVGWHNLCNPVIQPHNCMCSSFTKHHFQIWPCKSVARDWFRIGQTIVTSWLNDWHVTWIKNTKDCNISLRWIRSRVWLFSRTGNMWRVQLLQLHSCKCCSCTLSLTSIWTTLQIFKCEDYLVLHCDQKRNQIINMCCNIESVLNCVRSVWQQLIVDTGSRFSSFECVRHFRHSTFLVAA